MAANVAEVIIKAVDQATGPLKQIGGEADKMGASFTKAGAVMAVAGGAILGALGMAVKQASDWGTELNEANLKTGVATERLAGFAYAANMSGASLDDVTLAIGKTSQAIERAKSGQAAFIESFAALGISVEEIASLSPEDRFLLLADALKGAGADGAKLAASMQILGRGARNLLPMFEQGRAGILAYQKAAEDAGMALSGKVAGQLDNTGDALDGIKTSMRGIALQLGVVLAPAVEKAAKALTAFLNGLTAFSRAHPAAFRALTELAAGIGAVLIVVGPVLIIIGQLVGAIKTLGLVGGVAGAFAKLAAVWQSLVTIATAVGAAIGASAGFVVVAIAAILAFVKILGDQIVWAVRNWDLFKLEVRAFGEELWALITGPFVRLWENVAFMYDLGKGLIFGLWEGMKSVIQSFWNWVDGALVGPLREVGRTMAGFTGGAVGGGMANWRLPGSTAGAGELNVYVDGKKAETRRMAADGKVLVF